MTYDPGSSHVIDITLADPGVAASAPQMGPNSLFCIQFGQKRTRVRGRHPQREILDLQLY